MTTGNETIIAFPDMKEVEEQAALWIMRVDEGDMSKEQRVEFQAWLDRGVQHRETLERLGALWDGLDIVEELTDYAAAGDNLQSIEIDAMPRWKGLGLQALGQQARGRRSFMVAAAASIAVILGAGLAYQLTSDYRGLYQGNYETAVGEQETVSLPDGSTIHINTDSRIEVAYTKSARSVRLVYGEAFFDVTPNKQRPFSVYAGTGQITAVGTAFTVFLRDKKVDVIVKEGRVALFANVNGNQVSGSDFSIIDAGDAGPKKLLAELTVGQNAVFEQEIESLELLKPAVAERKLAWRHGRLAFAGEPLSEMIASVSRYTEIIIEIEDEDLRDLPIAGNFIVGEVDAMFEALEIMIDVRIERVDAKRVRIVKATQSR